MDREWLKQQLAAGRSYEEIARTIGRHASTVSYWARRHGLSSTHVPAHAARGAIDRGLLSELVDQGLSVREIATKLDRSGTTVRHWLRVYGLETRHTLASKLKEANEQVAVLPCPQHGKTRWRRDSRGWRCVRCRSEAVIRRRKRVKEILVREAGGRCLVCGYDRYVGALVFHHRDPAEKRFGINRLGTSLGRARIEAQKCVLLCANCHSEVEAGMARYPVARSSVHRGKRPA